MNKKIIFIIVIILCLVLVGGIYMFMNKKDTEEVESNVITNTDNEDFIESNNNILVLYFSATNSTEVIAQYISEVINADLVEIVPKDEYTKDDLDYNNSNSRANLEQGSDSARVEIENEIDISNYDIIYLGYPIWWGDVPKIILTLLDTYDFTGKTVIPFCTSGGTSIDTSVNTLKTYDNTINWLEGKRFSSASTISDVEDWINSIKY